MFEDFLNTMLSILILLGFFLIIWAGLTQKKVGELISDLIDKIKDMQPIEEVKVKGLI